MTWDKAKGAVINHVILVTTCIFKHTWIVCLKKSMKNKFKTPGPS